MIRVMVVDDEPLAQEELTKLIAEDNDFRVTGRASSGKESLEKLKKEAVDVLFLDIEMPGINGLEVASRLAAWENPPLVVFATAYHQYAIKAFDENAIDYILKPYEAKRIQKTLERVRQLLKSRVSGQRDKLVTLEDYLIRQGTLKKIVGHRRNSKDRMVLDPAEVFYFFADLSEVLAHVEQDDLLVNSTLKELLANLDPARFAQIHKSYLVNLDKVDKVSPLFNGNFQIALNDTAHTKIPLSRRYASSLKQRLGNW